MATALIVAVAATAGGALAASTATSTPSPLIYPAETIPLAFDHAQHARLGATCEGCHVSALTSTAAGDNLIPREAACRSCHKIDRDLPAKAVPHGQGAARCDACHVDADGKRWMPGGAGAAAEPPRVALARPNLKFNHKLHATRGIACALCHANAEMQQAQVTRVDLPMMATCLGCHDGKQATARCSACHLTEADGRLKTKLMSVSTMAAGANGPLVPSGSLRGIDAHGPTFRRDHAIAGRDESYCLTCHKRNECIDCHGGVVKPPDIHPSDYVSLHAVDARRNTPDCSSCHRTQSFCVGCHQRTGVGADPEGGLPGRRANNPFGGGTGVKTFHPPGWARDAGGAVISTPRPNSHAVSAQRNIRACASCHREESCLTCHSADPTRGPTFSPHGVNFRNTARCKFLAARNKRVCLKCHQVGAPELTCD
ncbi:MAG TPA: cytochrome c3 family protein [Polyangia bacterium]|nr:cytochrome c3 family protein [Polyangia bacterium]